MRLTGYFCSFLFAMLSLGAAAATVEVDSGYVGMGTVFWTEKTLANGTVRLTLKATASDDCAFAGWLVDERNVVAWPEDLRYPGALTVSVVSNAHVVATFVPRIDDTLSFDVSDVFAEELACGEEMSETLYVDSSSFPALTFENLPPGLSYDERTLTVSGAPTEPGIYEIEASGVNGSGFTFRSFCTVRVANVEGDHVSGIDTEIAADEYFYSEIGTGDASDLFSFSETPSSVSLVGSVPGLTWNGGWQLLYGTPTEPGEYTLGVEAGFPSGVVETATVTLTVAGDDPEAYGVDFSGLDDLRVGDVFDDTLMIGADSEDVTIRSVTGLPTGLSPSVRYEDGVYGWFVSGTVEEPGFFAVTVLVDDLSGDEPRTVKLRQRVTVSDVPDVYLSATSEDASRGTVSGGGAVSPFRDVTLVATARRGFVFAGWYDQDGEIQVLDENVDYRTDEITLVAGTDFAFLAPVAHFVPTEEDVAPDLVELDDVEFSFAPDEPFETSFAVGSLSLPKLTFKGLPKGVSCRATGTGDHVLAYDPWKSVAASGRYAVTVTAVNASGGKSSVTFRITVETRSDERIRVYDDYGEFTPGEEIDSIDLSDAVDFANGESLSVSGLPRGLAYNAKENAKKGLAAKTISGTPTEPGDYTLTFTAKVVSGATTNKAGKVTVKYETATATAFLTVLPYPALEIEVDETAAAAGCKVTGAGTYKAGTKLTLTATAAKGWVFAGWEWIDGVDGLVALNPKLSYVTGADDVWAQAWFVPVSEDGLSVLAPTLTGAGFAAEWPLKEELGEGDAALVADLIETVSWPTVRVDGLPPGVKFTASTFLLSGKPTKSGVYHVTVTAKSAGGYSFVRVLDVAVLNADRSLPSEKPLENAAAIDFSPLKGLTTGANCPEDAVSLSVGAKPGTGAAVKKVAVSGLPSGLAAAVATEDGAATVAVTGTPTKPGRFVVAVSVTYADGKTLKSQAAVVVEDGGSQYLFVTSDDADAGTVSGEGVYAAGATVKLVAKAKSKHAFAGWWVADGEDGQTLFTPLRDIDGVDPRTAAVSFPFRPADFAERFELSGRFVAAAEDLAPTILLEDEGWEINPCEPSTFAFSVQSLSVPKVTVTGLPKGVTVDTARGVMSYLPTDSAQPGVYAATFSAKNTTVAKASARSLAIRVANRTSEAIGGLNPDRDAYPLTVGVAIDPGRIVPEVDEGWALSVKGLPPGMSFVGGAVTGVPSKAGDYTVTFVATTGKGASKRTETATVTIRVTAFPAQATGTYTGLVTDAGGVRGTLTFTVPASGKVSAKIQVPGKTLTFSGTSWETFVTNVASVCLKTRDGSSLTVSLRTASDWTDWQLTAATVLDAVDCHVCAQRNPFGEKNGSADAKESLRSLVGTHKTADGWTVKIDKKGAVTLSGKHNGKTVSGSSTLQYDESFITDYVKFMDKKSILWLNLMIGGKDFVITSVERHIN